MNYEYYPNSASYILRGKNYFRYILIVLLTSIITIGIYTIQFVGFVFIIMIISALFGLLIIRFPYIYVYKNCFVIIKKSILKKFSSQEVFDYNEINEIEFLPGSTKWLLLIIVSIFGNLGYDRYSKPDRMKLKLKSGKVKIIYRFGKRREFENMIQNIKKSVIQSKLRGL